MKNLLLLFFIFACSLHAANPALSTPPVPSNSQDLIEKAIDTIDLALLQKELDARPLRDSEKMKYLDMVNEKIDFLKRKIDLEEWVEHFKGTPPVISGYSALAFLGSVLGLMAFFVSIPYFYKWAPAKHYKKSFFAAVMLSLVYDFGLLYCVARGEEEVAKYKKKRDQDYKNIFKIKYALLATYDTTTADLA